MESKIHANSKSIAKVWLFNERHKLLTIDERAEMLGLTVTTYTYYLDKWVGILFHSPRNIVEILRSKYASIINQKFEVMEIQENKRHRASKYESDVLCAQCYHSFLLGQQKKIKEFWYYVERHNDLYGIDPHYTAIFNGNQQRVLALMQLRGEQAYKPAP